MMIDSEKTVTQGNASVAFVASMGLRPGLVIQEMGWDSDVDEDLGDAIMDAIDGELVGTADEAADAVLLWWRHDDGDLADGLVDAMADLSAAGPVWLLVPKVGQPNHVDPADIAEAASTAGFAVTNPANAAPGWQAVKLVRGKGRPA